MSRPIVVPLDGSPLAEGALPHAIAIAHQLHAPVQLVRVLAPVPPPYHTFGASPVDRVLDQSLADEAADGLAQVAERWRGSGVTVDAVVRTGEVVPTLAELVEQDGAQLVVMTTHGRSGWRRAMLGSVADSLVRSVDAAVLAVPAPDGVPMPAPTLPVPVLLPLDGTENDDCALDLATLAREALDAQLTLLHVLAPVIDRERLPVRQVDRVDLRERRGDMGAYLDRVAALLGAPQLPIGHEVVMGESPAEGILDVAGRRGIGHVAMVTKGQRGLGKWVIGSVADRLLRDGRLALLLVRARP